MKIEHDGDDFILRLTRKELRETKRAMQCYDAKEDKPDSYDAACQIDNVLRGDVNTMEHHLEIDEIRKDEGLT